MSIISQEKRKSLDGPEISVRPKLLKVSKNIALVTFIPKNVTYVKDTELKGLEDTYSLQQFQHNRQSTRSKKQLKLKKIKVCTTKLKIWIS